MLQAAIPGSFKISEAPLRGNSGFTRMHLTLLPGQTEGDQRTGCHCVRHNHR